MVVLVEAAGGVARGWSVAGCVGTSASVVGGGTVSIVKAQFVVDWQLTAASAQSGEP